MAIGSASFYSIYPITARQTIKHDDTHFTPTAQRLDAVADMAGYGVSHPAYVRHQMQVLLGEIRREISSVMVHDG